MLVSLARHVKNLQDLDLSDNWIGTIKYIKKNKCKLILKYIFNLLVSQLYFNLVYLFFCFLFYFFIFLFFIFPVKTQQ